MNGCVHRIKVRKFCITQSLTLGVKGFSDVCVRARLLFVGLLFLLADQVKVKQHAVDLQLQPLNIVLRKTIDVLQTKDPGEIFAEPVDTEEVCISLTTTRRLMSRKCLSRLPPIPICFEISMLRAVSLLIL